MDDQRRSDALCRLLRAAAETFAAVGEHLSPDAALSLMDALNDGAMPVVTVDLAASSAVVSIVKDGRQLTIGQGSLEPVNRGAVQ
jgi:hypothetical protein